MLFDNGAGSSPTDTQTAGDPYPGFEDSFSSYPIPGTTAADLVLRARRQARRTAAGGQGNRQRHVHLQRERPAADRLRQQHRHRRPVGQRLAVGMELGAASGGLRGLVRVGTAEERHRGDRRRRRAPVGEVLDARRRPPGDGQRSAAGRQRNVRAGRLDLRASERKLATNANNLLKEQPTELEPIPTMLPKNVRADARRAGTCRWSSRCTSRDTPTVRVRRSGSRSRRPTEPSRSGRSARHSRKAGPRRCRSRTRAASRRV